ncbi:23-bisphosphoglycerate-dependent phosphoglycerate mutase, partial [Trifolium medium]|nr:23-bisphosphoglycerate-dependent phosphoglycerate mutase [Trifolium medium]
GGFLFAGDQPLNMLGVIQSQKSAELLLDLSVSSIISSPNKSCIETATAISQANAVTAAAITVAIVMLSRRPL